MILYYSSFAAGLVFAVALNILAGAKRGVNAKRASLYTLSGFVAAVIGAMLMAKIYNTVLRSVSDGESFGMSRVSLYGGLLFMPLMMLLFIRGNKENPSVILSVCTPGVYALLSIAKLGCFAYGCCYGIPFEKGIFNANAGEKVFPVQLLESVLTLIITLLVYRLAVKTKRPACVYPAGLMMYSFMRFFAQFLRHHDVEADKNLVLFMDFWQTVSVSAFVISGIILAYLFFVYKKVTNTTK